jgi:hypothetical protein
VKRSPMPQRRTGLARGKRLKPRNQTRSTKAFARNYGDEAAAVRLLPCLAHGRGLIRCLGPTHVAHVTARGRGGCKGGRFDVVPLCARHHEHAGEAGTSQRADFEELYTLDLRAEADAIALAHSEPLGIRGLARRWAAGLGACTCDDGRVYRSEASVLGELRSKRGTGEAIVLSFGFGGPERTWSNCPYHENLDDHERGALLGWVRLWLDRDAGLAHHRTVAHDRDTGTCFLADKLGIGELVCRDLIAASGGWPS